MAKVSEKSERKSKKGASSSKQKTDSTDNPPKVSTEEIQQDEIMNMDESENETTTTTTSPMTETTATEQQQHEVRSILRVIPKDEENVKQCSMEGCDEEAVVEWTISTAPDDIQHSCENCQPAEFTNDAAATTTNMAEPKNDVADTSTNSLSKEKKGDTRTVKEDGALQSDQDADAAQVSTEEESRASSADGPEGSSSKSTNDESSHDDETSVKSSSGDTSVQDTLRTTGEELTEVTLVEMTPSSPTVSTMVDEEIVYSPLTTAPSAILATPKPTSMDWSSTEVDDQQASCGADASDGRDSNAEGDPNADAMEEDGGGGDDDGEEVEEQWDLIKVFSEENFTNAPVICDTEDCGQIACVRYANTASAQERWSGCLDCQYSEFGGWPETLKDFPVDFLAAQHRHAIIEHCSKNEKAQEWPDFLPDKPSEETTKSSAKIGNNKNINTQALTPVPHSHQARGGKGKGKSLVTPSPHPLSNKPPPKAATKKKPSKALMATHQKWQKEAEAVGGKGVKIIVDKAAAKQKIYDFSFDSFQPKTVTDFYTVSVLVHFVHVFFIYFVGFLVESLYFFLACTGLSCLIFFSFCLRFVFRLTFAMTHRKFQGMKCIIPAVVLKTALDDMAALNEPFEMSDDDDDDDDEGQKSKSKGKNAKTKQSDSTDPLTGSLCFKAGRSAGSSLYYVDHNKTKNNGNLDAHEANELTANNASAEAELAMLFATQKSVTAEADKLYGEPTNDEAAQLLVEEVPIVESLRDKVTEAQSLKENVGHRKKLKRSIEKMTSEWRKRSRLCRDFLIGMEDLTEGTVSMKKCLKGDGQIEVESDEATLEISKEYAAKKRMKALSGKKAKTKRGIIGSSCAKKTTGVMADENFIGVTLTSQGTVKREYFQED